MEKKEKQIGNYYVLNKVLGKGSFAICQKGCLVSDNSQLVAVKIIDKRKILSMESKEKSQQELEKIKREISILKSLNNEHIVKLLDLSQTDNNLYLFLEFCNGGSLEEYLKKNEGQLSEDEAQLILSELLEAFLEMNEKNLMHRDIKPANILIHNGKIKLADFGFSRVFEESDNAQKYTTLGTPLYVTPQVLFGQVYSSKCDVWSIGAVIYELIFGFHPFYHGENPQSISDLKNILLKKKLSFNDKSPINPLFKDLLEKMLAQNEEDRLSWKQIKDHKFFKQQQEQFQSNLSKYKSEQDPFKKSLIMNEMYLKENLVAGNIVKKQLNTSQSEIKEELNKNGQQFQQISNYNNLSKINEIFEVEEQQDQFQKIYEYVLFERNVAIFYYDVIKKLWNQFNKEMMPIPQSLLLRLMFCLAKIGLLFLKRIYEMVVQGNIPFFQDEQLIQRFLQTAHYKNALNFIEGDLNNNTQLFTNLLFKTKSYFQEDSNVINLDESSAVEVQNFMKILNDDLDQSKDFKLTFIVSIRKTLELVKDKLDSMDNSSLGLIRLIQIALNPYNQFKFQKNKDPSAPDIRKFYSKIEKSEKSKLIEIILQSY